MDKLTAVQEMLARSGLQHVSALDTNGASMAAFAERVLDREEYAFQSIGWHYNTRRNIELGPTLFTFDNAAWTASTKGITQPGKFSAATVGQTVRITAGAATLGDVKVTAVDPSGNWVNVDTSINTIDLASGVKGEAVNNIIPMPTGALWIDTDIGNYSNDLAQNGARLYDVDNDTTFFTDTKRFTYALRFYFQCIPPPYDRLILLKAALSFNESYGSSDRRRGIERDLYEHSAHVRAHDIRMSDFNVLNSVENSRVRGLRRTGVYVQGTWFSP